MIYVTKTHKVLTEEDIEALANEALAGYDTSPAGQLVAVEVCRACDVTFPCATIQAFYARV